MKASVIVPTYNGEAKIACVLEALTRQTENDFELVVVVDGSTDNTVEVLDKYRSRFKHFKIITQQNLGRSSVRNKGVTEVNSSLLIFFDDDTEPLPDSVARHIKFHQEYDGILSGDSVEWKSSSKTDIQNYKASRAKIWTDKYTDGLTRMQLSNLFFTAANCSFRKDTFLALHGFDERLTDAEDQDLATRAMENGIAVYFDKKNQAIHHDKITARSYIRRIRNYQTAHRRLHELYPHRNPPIVSQKSIVKRILYKLFASPKLVDLIDNNFFKTILPELIRYKLYDIIIQALGVEYPEKPL